MEETAPAVLAPAVIEPTVAVSCSFSLVILNISPILTRILCHSCTNAVAPFSSSFVSLSVLLRPLSRSHWRAGPEVGPGRGVEGDISLGGCGGLGDPAQVEVGPVGVLWAPCGLVVVGQAIGAPGNRPGPAREDLVVEPRVCHGPVEVLPGQGLSAVLPVIEHPALPLEVVLGPDDRGWYAQSSGAFSGKCWQKMAAMVENLSIPREMSMIAGRASMGRQLVLANSSSTAMSAISTNSKSRMWRTSLGGRAAARLYGPGVRRAGGKALAGITAGLRLV